MSEYGMIELTVEEIDSVSGGLVPLIPIAVALGKGIIWGVGAAATVHVGIQLYDLLTS